MVRDPAKSANTPVPEGEGDGILMGIGGLLREEVVGEPD
jgi:hypothetical protein